MQALGPISRWQLRNSQMTTDMLRLITGEPDPEIVMTQRVAFSCNCTVQRAARALALLESQEEKEGNVQNVAETEIRCEYCGKTYTIGSSQTDSLKKKPATKKQTKAKKTAKKARK
jgi:redox-regulated HSP33 family molecular chaperone